MGCIGCSSTIKVLPGLFKFNILYFENNTTISPARGEQIKLISKDFLKPIFLFLPKKPIIKLRVSQDVIPTR